MRKRDEPPQVGGTPAGAPDTGLAELETYRQVFWSSPDFISISRLADGIYVDVNPGFEQFTGFSRSEVVGRSALEIGVWPDSAEREKFVAAMGHSGRLQAYATRLRNRQGEVRNVELTASVVVRDGVELLVIVVRDVTERRHDEIELKLYRERLEHLVEERTVALRRANEQLQETNERLELAHNHLLQTEKRIRYMAQHDVLTGLPNRALLQDRVTQAISQAYRDSKLMALLFIDLDNFKQINDSLGHLVGDDLLRLVAARLTQCVRRTDTVARLGGDEFVICLPGMDSGTDAALLAQKVLDSLETPFIIDEQELHAGASIGISIFPADGIDAEALMQAADTSMYHAKELGRANYQFFTPALNTAVQQRLLIESQLRQALPRNEFLVMYQPQVEIASGKIVSAEALIRWQQPIRGLISPMEFIPIAEDTGMILRIGEWVLREACGQVKRWRDAGHPEMGIAVNLSTRQVLQPGFARIVQGILDEIGLPPHALDMEITESVLMQPSDENIATLKDLANMGVRLSVDDFGTGFSSLSYLNRFPIHALKIDRSFVRGLEHDTSDRAITSTIIAMARNLHLKVMAEGVETSAQATFLVQNDCLLAQGYFYGKPLSAEEFGELLNIPARLKAQVELP
jgi:diguanylate cyclase (GGDEF)-like protein/PAS domain S-box-containing protein